MTPGTAELGRLLQRVLKVEAAEVLPLTLLLVHGFAKGLTFVYFETTANAGFLAHYGPELLPYVYLCTALTSTLLGIALARLEPLVSPGLFLAAIVAFLLLSIAAAFVLLIASDARWPAFALMVWKDVIFILTELEFWAVAGYLFNVRQGKRLFGLAGVGAIVAGILGGLGAPLVIALLGENALLLVAALSALGMLLTLALILRLFPERFAPADEPQTQAADWSLRALARRPYIVLLCLFTALSFYCYYTVDFAFYAEVNRHWQDAASLAVFFGIFYAALNGAMLFTSTVLSGRLLLRYGLPIGLLAVPLVEYLGSLSALLAGLSAAGLVLVLMVGLKLLDEVLRVSFEGPGYRILYQALPTAVRLRVQALRESIVEPVAVGLAGLIFLAATRLGGLDGRTLLSWLLFLIPLWILVALKLRASYTQTLGETLERRTIGRGELDLADPSARAVLEQALGGTTRQASYALEVLDDLPSLELAPWLGMALDHPDETIRTAALEQAARRGQVTLAGRADTLADADPSPLVRGMALQALGTLSPDLARARLHQHLDDPAPAVRNGALAGLLLAGDLDTALARLRGLAGREDPAARCQAATVIGIGIGIGTAAVPAAGALLQPLLTDADPRVRRAALAAAARVKDPALLPTLLETLGLPDTGEETGAAFTAYGAAAVPTLARALSELYAAPGPGQGTRLRRHAALLRVASLIGDPAARLIYPYLDLYGTDRQQFAISALAYCGHRVAGGEHRAAGAELDRLDRQLLLESSGIAWGQAALADLQARADLGPVLRAVEADITAHRSNLILLLAPRLGTTRVLTAHDRLGSGSVDTQAAALELLDNLLPPELKPVVLPVLDSSGVGALVPGLRLLQQRLSAPERLAALVPACAFPLPWTRALALHTLAQAGLAQAAPLIREAALDRSAIVRETALLGAERLGWPAAEVQGLALGMALDPDPALRRLARALADPAELQRLAPGLALDPSSERPMYPTVEKVLILKSVEIFSGIAEQQLLDLASMLEERSFAPGQAIFRQGEEGDSMYIIARGQVRIHIGEHELRIMGEHEVFGEMAALDPAPRSASVTALEETQTFRITGANIVELIDQHPPVARAIIRVQCRRQRAAEAQRFGPPEPGHSAPA